MQHIINIAFDFDDDKVRQVAERKVANEMDDVIKGIVLDRIAPVVKSFYGGGSRGWDNFDSRVDDIIIKYLNEHKEEIIDNASKKLMQRLANSKAWKDKYEDILGKLIEGDA